MPSDTSKSDADLKRDVLAELKYEPSVQVTDIGVLVKDGAVTLNGFVGTWGERKNAVRAAKRVIGVKGIADDIEVRLVESARETDGDIAAAAAAQIERMPSLPSGAIDVIVREGQVTLEGNLEWDYQRTAAVAAVQHLAGVTAVINRIGIRPTAEAGDIAGTIESALVRSALLDAGKINVEAVGTKVTVRGEVRNYAERDEAERIAWAAPGVSAVDNQLDIEFAWEPAD